MKRKRRFPAHYDEEAGNPVFREPGLFVRFLMFVWNTIWYGIPIVVIGAVLLLLYRWLWGW